MMRMDGDKLLYDCILCQRSFQHGPNVYGGKLIAEWEVAICDGCIKANWDGIVPGTYSRLMEHFRERGIRPPKPNARGWWDIPGQK
jgi:hypothetical protein